MRVERCPSCGARYNVSRLATGAPFSCRRCGAVVVVGAQEGATRGPRTRLGLVVLAVLGLAATVLRGLQPAGAWSGPDGDGVLLDLPLEALVALATAALACALAGWLGLRARPALACAAATAAFWVVARALGPEPGPLTIHGADPAGFLGLVLVAAGALLLAGPHREGRSIARAWALVGAGLVTAGLAGSTTGPEAPSRLAAAAGDVAAFWRDVVWRGGTPADGASPWAREIPWTAQASAALLTVLAAALAFGRVRGLSRFLARSGFLLLVIAAVTPPLAAAWAQRDELLGAEGALRTLGLVTHAAWDAGIVPALLAILVLGACAGERDAARRSSPATPRPRAGPRHAALALVAAATILCLENPGYGVVSTRWPWEEAALGITSVASATAWLFGALLAAASLACLAPPLRRGGTLVAFGAALAAGASDLRVPQFGVPAFTIPCLVAAGAGLLWAQRGTPWSTGGQLTSAAVGTALLGLLLWPRASPEILGGAHGPLLWSCVANSLGAGSAMIGSAIGPSWEDLLRRPTAQASLALLAGLVFLLASITGPRRVLAGIALVLAATAALHPVAEAFLRAVPWGAFEGTPSLVEAGRAAGRALLVHPAAVVWATFVVSAEAASGPRT